MTLAAKFYAETVAAMISADVDGYEDGEYRPPTEQQIRKRLLKRKHWMKYKRRKEKKA